MYQTVIPCSVACLLSSAMKGWIDGCRMLSYCLVVCRCVEAMQEACEGPQGTSETSRTGHKVGFVC